MGPEAQAGEVPKIRDRKVWGCRASCAPCQSWESQPCPSLLLPPQIQGLSSGCSPTALHFSPVIDSFQTELLLLGSSSSPLSQSWGSKAAPAPSISPRVGPAPPLPRFSADTGCHQAFSWLPVLLLLQLLSLVIKTHYLQEQCLGYLLLSPKECSGIWLPFIPHSECLGRDFPLSFPEPASRAVK